MQQNASRKNVELGRKHVKKVDSVQVDGILHYFGELFLRVFIVQVWFNDVYKKHMVNYLRLIRLD